MRTVLLAAAALVLLCGTAAWAQGGFEDDFESGLGERWRGDPGRGDIRLTEYAGNHSLRLQRNAWAATVVALPENAVQVRVAVSFAADDLEGTDACRLETSIDGQTWRLAGEIGDGLDDAVSLHRVGADVPDAAGRPWIAVRLRIDGNASNDTCWADGLRVGWSRPAAELAQEIPEGSGPLSAPLAAQAFAMPAGAVVPEAVMSFQIRLDGRETPDGFRVVHDEFDYAGEPGITAIPPLQVDWVGRDGRAWPLQRRPQPGDSPYWEWVVQPGRVWLAAGGLQIRFPVALQERNANCLHTGWLAIGAGASGEAAQGVLQIGAETCAYYQFELWSRLNVSVEPIELPADLPREDQPFERRHIAALSEDFEGADPAGFGSPLEVSPEAMSVFGVLIDDVVYAGGCQTRFGPDPFCAGLALPSYSLAKSVVGGLALMRLEHLYPGARVSLVSDYVDACDAERWAGVTFEHALDMATGLYTSAEFDADEGAPELWEFMSRSTHAERIDLACNQHPRQSEPGSRWVYHTTDTYVLGTAMQAFWRAQTGRADADFYDDLLVPLWRELNLSPLMGTTRRSYDGVRQPVSGWGLTLTLDDMMRLGRFLQEGGQVGGDAWADPAMLAAALQRDPADRGLAAGSDVQRYQNGFWAWNAGPALGCASDVWIPALSGYGGITLALIPNGHVYAYVSDGREFAWRRAAVASHAIQPYCEDAR